MTASGHMAGLTITADMWVEYDGFLWVELRAEDSTAGRQIDSLRVLVMLPSKHATLYQTHARRPAGWIDREPISLRWLARPGAHTVNFYHWLGNEDRGLGFTFALIVIASVREILGTGKIWDLVLLGETYNPVLMAILSPGAFITLGLLIGLFNLIEQKRS